MAPSRKIILVLVVLVALFAGAATIYFFAPHIETYKAPITAATTTESAILAKDSDSDGLKDWEEELWKTDSHNADTDGDGTPDGSEIKSGRNPTLAGPNDKLDTETVSQKVNTETESDLSETDKFSRELFMKIVAAKTAQTPPTEDDLKNFFNTSVAQEIAQQKVNSYTSADFQVDTAETAQKIKLYGNAIAQILTQKPPKPLEYEISIVDRAQQKNDPTELKKLEENVAAFKRIEKDLLGTTVPQSAVSLHVALTNATAAMVWSITALEYILTDPIKALPGTSAYADNAQNFVISVDAFKTYFQKAGTVFESGDRGYGFFDAI